MHPIGEAEQPGALRRPYLHLARGTARPSLSGGSDPWMGPDTATGGGVVKRVDLLTPAS